MEIGGFDGYVLAPLRREDDQALRGMQPGDLSMSRGEWLFPVGGEEGYITAALAERVSGRELRAGIWLGAQLVGVICLRRCSVATGSISYALDARYRGQGIMTRACRVLLDHGFRVLRLERILIIADHENQSSCSIPVRLGFTRERVLPDLYCGTEGFRDGVQFSLLASAWNAGP